MQLVGIPSGTDVPVITASLKAFGQSLDFTFKASGREADDDDRPGHGVELQLRARW